MVRPSVACSRLRPGAAFSAGEPQLRTPLYVVSNCLRRARESRTILRYRFGRASVPAGECPRFPAEASAGAELAEEQVRHRTMAQVLYPVAHLLLRHAGQLVAADDRDCRLPAVGLEELQQPLLAGRLAGKALDGGACPVKGVLFAIPAGDGGAHRAGAPFPGPRGRLTTCCPARQAREPSLRDHEARLVAELQTVAQGEYPLWIPRRGKLAAMRNFSPADQLP